MKKAFHKIVHLFLRFSPSNKIRIFFLKTLGAKVIGTNYIAQNLFIMDGGNTNLLTIGPRVAIGPNVTLVIHSDPSPSSLSAFYPVSNNPIVIEKDVWIGASVTILGGITIGEKSIVAAGSIVIKDVPSYSIVAGNPAKIIKRLK